MVWLHAQDPIVVTAALLSGLLVTVAIFYSYVYLRRHSQESEQVLSRPAAATTTWPPGADDNPEPYQLYFEQLNSVLEPIEPFSLDQFKSGCALPATPFRVRFNSEGGFTTESTLQEGERR